MDVVTWDGRCQLVEEALVDALRETKGLAVRAAVHPRSLFVLAQGFGFNAQDKVDFHRCGDRTDIVKRYGSAIRAVSSVSLRFPDAHLDCLPSDDIPPCRATLYDAADAVVAEVTLSA